MEGEPLPGKGHLVLNPEARLKKHYLLLSRTNKSRNYGRDGRGLLNGFNPYPANVENMVSFQ